MTYWPELLLDLITVLLIAAGAWLIYPPAGLIVGGLGVGFLSIGVRARRLPEQESTRPLTAYEIDEQ